MLTKKSGGDASAASKFTSSMKNMKGAMGIGFGAYAVVAMILAIVCGLLTEMSIPMFIIWVLFAAFAALASELIVGISAMHSGWFPGLRHRSDLPDRGHAHRLPPAGSWVFWQASPPPPVPASPIWPMTSSAAIPPG